MKKSYHSMVVPIALAAKTLRFCAIVLSCIGYLSRRKGECGRLYLEFLRYICSISVMHITIA
jgi:hypothetical protein